MIHFIIPGEPQGKGRPRMTRAGHTYTPEKTTNYENLIRYCFDKAKPAGFEPYKSAVSMLVTLRYSIPKSATRKNKAEMLNQAMLPLKKPDVDNVLKVIADSLNGFAYNDDCQIAYVEVRKEYSVEPCVCVTINEYYSF